MLLRVIFVGVIARLMLLPYLHLIGGLALLVIAAKLIVPDEPDRSGDPGRFGHLLRAVMIIAVADIVMSLDNVIAIAALAQGNLLLLIIGLAVSIPLIMVGATADQCAARPVPDPDLGRRGAARLGRWRRGRDGSRGGEVSDFGVR